MSNLVTINHRVIRLGATLPPKSRVAILSQFTREDLRSYLETLSGVPPSSKTPKAELINQILAFPDASIVAALGD